MIESELSKISQVDEHWKQIANFSRYWISDLGNVYDVIRHRLLRTKADADGYILVDLRNDDNIVRSKRVHRLVAEAFLPDWTPEWPWTVNHMNGKKDDNRLINLEMLTAGDNSRHYQTATCFAESRKVQRAKMSAKMKLKCSDAEYASKMSDRMKQVWSDPNNREMYINCLYERHSDPNERKHISDKLKEVCSDPEYRKGMSDRQKQNWKDPKYRNAMMNQNQDRVWVNDGSAEKWIHRQELSEYLSKGYTSERLAANLVLSTKDKIHISDGVHDRFVSPEDLTIYTSQGWYLGRSNRKHVKCVQTGQIFSSVEACAKAFNTNVDLIHSRCKGTAKNPRKLKGLDFCYYEGEDPFADLR